MIYQGNQYYDLRRLLTARFAQVPAWRDLADATNELFEREIETPRRRLAKSRDSVLYRKDEVVNGLTYTGEGQLQDSKTDVPVDMVPGTRLPSAKILAIQENVAVDGAPAQDYMLVEFNISNGRTLHWRLPINAPQERSVLIQNGYMLGFDFFNTQLDDKDYQRIQEYIALYWPKGGTLDFVKFMSFIKDIRFEAIPLWTYDDNTENINALEEFKPNRVLPIPTIGNAESNEKMPPMISTTKGGEWYQTSHVELRYNPIQDAIDGKIDIYNPAQFQGIEELFYYFAPIHLVLQRIVAAIDMYFDFFMASAGQMMELAFAKTAYVEKEIPVGDLLYWSGQVQDIHYAIALYTIPDMESEIRLNVAGQLQEMHYSKSVYVDLDDELDFNLIVAGQVQDLHFSHMTYKYDDKIENAEIVINVAGQVMEIQGDKAKYVLPAVDFNLIIANAGQQMTIELASPAKYEDNTALITVNLMVAGQLMYNEYQKWRFTPPPAAPAAEILAKIYQMFAGQAQPLFYSKVDRAAMEESEKELGIALTVAGQIQQIYLAKTVSQRRV